MSELTKRAIQESFKKLLSNQPLDKITVKNITDDCGVNRNTFYYHYSDIYQLLEEIFLTEAQKSVEKMEVSVVGGRTQDRALLRKGEQEADIPCI